MESQPKEDYSSFGWLFAPFVANPAVLQKPYWIIQICAGVPARRE